VDLSLEPLAAVGSASAKWQEMRRPAPAFSSSSRHGRSGLLKKLDDCFKTALRLP
jgi:hypothetical protein